MPIFAVDELVIAPELTDDFVTAIRVGNAVEEITYGTPDLAYEPEEELPYFTDRFTPTRLVVARVDGRIVGRGVYETRVGEEADTAWLSVLVLPKYRGQGIGRALADSVECIAREAGKAKAVSYTAIRDADGPRLDSPTGFGSVPAEDRTVRFLGARGYSLEQIERVSRMHLPLIGVEKMLATAAAASGDDYRVHTWVGSTPERWIDDLAVLETRMSTDAPSAGLEEPEDVWTRERIIAADERNAKSPRTRLTAAVEHIPSGTLAGYTVLSAPRQRHRAVAQYATLVLREHRGHRLGMLLKVANLEHLARVSPGHPSVTTFNAEENRHMLSVNEAVGFVGIASESAWRLDL